MDDYLITVLEQIRYTKMYPEIEQELRGHIEEQAMANRASGMEEEEAMRCAIQDMGDPVETGVELDRIHRPKMAWDVIAVMAAVALASILIHIVIGLGSEEINFWPQNVYIAQAVVRTVAGFLIMLLVYRIDYSVLAKYGRLCAAVFLAFMTLGVFVFGLPVQGAATFFYIAGVSFSIPFSMFLYVPLYGAVLYQYRGSGWAGLLKSLVFLIYPIWLLFRIPIMSVALLLLLLLSALLSVAVLKDWFRIPKKIVLTMYWTVLAAIPAGGIIMAVNGFFLSEYQQKRILSFLDNGARQYDYVARMLAEYLKGSRLFGAGSEAVAGRLPNYYSSYILTFLSTYFGIAAACAVCLLIGAIVVKAFRIAFRQKNQLGMMMGLGSGLVLFANMALNILENTGLFPTTMTFLPFFSGTRTAMTVSYILAGIVLSVYRYKSILPADLCAPVK